VSLPAVPSPRLLAGAGLALVLLAGCGADGEGASSASSSSSSPTQTSASADPGEGETSTEGAEPGGPGGGAAVEPCTLLDEASLRDLAGTDLGEGGEGRVGALPACQWGSPGSTGVQVVSVTAEQWATELPALMAQVRASGAFDDAANTRRLEKAGRLISQGRDISAAEACGLFSELAELQGNEPGSDSTVTLLPTAREPQAISAQTCADGRYASVLLITRGITGSPEQVRTVTDALRQVNDAG
jgi:hypothetical protein